MPPSLAPTPGDAAPAAAEMTTATVAETENGAEIEQVARSTSRKLLTLLGIGALLLVIVHTTPLGDHVRNWDALTETVKAGGIKAYAYFFLISTFLIMVGTPRLLFYGLGGFAFGFWEGLLWSLLSSLLGSFLSFRAARWGGRDWLLERFSRRPFFNRIAQAKPTVSSVALMRMLPVSNAIINAGLALSHVRNRAFLIGSLVGFLPQGIVAVVIGSGMAEDVPWAGAAQIALAAVLLLVPLYWSSRQRRQ